MKPAVFAPRALLERKAPHGQPCTRCGLCCLGSLCPLALHVFGGEEHRACPALQWDSGGSACGLVADPGKYAPMHVLRAGGPEKASAAASLLIGSGTGCDARVNGERPDAEFYAKLLRWDRENLAKVRDAKRTWGAKP